MERVLIKDALKSIDTNVTIYGWIHRIRDFGKMAFVIVRDRTGMMQVILEEKQSRLRLECVVKISGVVAANNKAPFGAEIHCKTIDIISDVEYELLPIEINNKNINAGLDVILDHRVLSLRNPMIHSVFKIQNEIVNSFREFFISKDFIEIQTPKIVAEGTEGGSELFPVKYFGRKVYLAQSPQFYKQMMVAAGYERVFEVGHAYRAEIHNTPRHLNEYVSLDAEMGFIKDETEIMDIENKFLEYLFKVLNEKCGDELKEHGIKLSESFDIPRITLKDARDIIKSVYGKSSPACGIDPEGEKLICRYVKEKYSCDFVFLTKYPVKKRPVYAMPDSRDNKLTNSFDLIYKGLEITTGGQRINSYSALRENMIKFRFDPDKFKFYLDTFKYGVPPHGGFAIGLERLTARILNLPNIREASLFPRDIERVAP